MACNAYLPKIMFLLKKMAEGGASVVGSLFRDQEGQTCQCFPTANQCSDSKLSRVCYISRWVCAREGRPRGCVRNKNTCVGQVTIVCFVCCPDILFDPCFDGKLDYFLGKERNLCDSFREM